MCSAIVKNSNFYDLWWIVRSIIAISWHARDLLYQFHARVIALSKNRVPAIQMRHRNFGNEKLRSVSARPRVGIGQPPGLIKHQVPRCLILELIARITRAVACRIAALNHEVRDHTMENSSVV